MSRAHVALLLLTAACGRVAFDPLENVVPEAGVDTGVDTTISSACPRGSRVRPAADQRRHVRVHVVPEASTPVPGVALDVLDANRDLINTAISDAAGAYALAVATGGAPRVAIVYAIAAGYFKTVIEADRPFASDTTGAGQPLWSLGDVPLWTGTAVGQVRRR